MAWLNRVPKPCKCELPEIDGTFWIGSRWQCDTCKKIYKLEESQQDGYLWAMEANRGN